MLIQSRFKLRSTVTIGLISCIGLLIGVWARIWSGLNTLMKESCAFRNIGKYILILCNQPY